MIEKYVFKIIYNKFTVSYFFLQYSVQDNKKKINLLDRILYYTIVCIFGMYDEVSIGNWIDFILFWYLQCFAIHKQICVLKLWELIVLISLRAEWISNKQSRIDVGNQNISIYH